MNKEELDILRKCKIMVGTPMYGGMCSGQYTTSMCEFVHFCVKNEIEMNVNFRYNESLITRARNDITHDFVNSDFTHLIFIDADTRFHFSDILTLAIFNEPIVTGPVPKKLISWENVRNAIINEKEKMTEEELASSGCQYAFTLEKHEKEVGDDALYRLLEVNQIGSAFIMIKKEVFLDIKKNFPELSFKDYERDKDGNTIEKFRFFDTMVEEKTKHYLSEDYFFCEKAKAVGYKIKMCPWLKIGHIGSCTYEGNLQVLAKTCGLRV